MAVLAAAVTAGALAYANRRLSEVERVALDDVLAGEELEDGDPQNFLIVGIDDASGLPDGDSVRNRDASDLRGQHTDTIMVLRLDPRAATAQLLSLPRDLWVPIADTNTNQRINVALETGGPERLIRTIDQNFGIPVHHYLQVDFAGFRDLVDIVDGVPVLFPHPARDRESGLSIEAPGCYTLGPVQALGFARGRYYYVQDDDGDWHQDPRSDLARNERQQLFMQLALSRAIAKGARNPNTLRRLIDLGAGEARLDEELDPGDLVALGASFRSFDPQELETLTLPVTDGTAGGAEILYLEEAAAEPVLSVFRGVGPVGTADPEGVTVQVLNGTGVGGQGADVTDELVAAGFEAVVPEDAEQQGQPTTIRYAEGNEAEAQLVARHVAGPVRYEADLALLDTDRVVVVTGSDWEGVAPTPKAVDAVDGPATTTTTTAPQGPPDTGPGGEPVTEGDPDDPGDPLFYKAQAAPPGASCPSTP